MYLFQQSRELGPSFTVPPLDRPAVVPIVLHLRIDHGPHLGLETDEKLRDLGHDGLLVATALLVLGKELGHQVLSGLPVLERLREIPSGLPQQFPALLRASAIGVVALAHPSSLAIGALNEVEEPVGPGRQRLRLLRQVLIFYGYP